MIFQKKGELHYMASNIQIKLEQNGMIMLHHGPKAYERDRPHRIALMLRCTEMKAVQVIDGLDLYRKLNCCLTAAAGRSAKKQSTGLF